MEDKIRKIGIYLNEKIPRSYSVHHEIPEGTYPSSRLARNDNELLIQISDLLFSKGSMNEKDYNYLPHFSPHIIKFDYSLRKNISSLFEKRNEWKNNLTKD